METPRCCIFPSTRSSRLSTLFLYTTKTPAAATLSGKRQPVCIFFTISSRMESPPPANRNLDDKTFPKSSKTTPTHVIKNLNTPKNGASGPKMAAFSSETCGKVLTFFLPATQTNPEPFEGRSPLSLQRLPSHSPSHTSLCTWEKVVGLFASWIALPAAPAATEAKGIV